MASSIQEIAKIAGVSTATVSRVFNKHSNVRPELAERITEIALEKGYHPRQATRKDTIIILMEDFDPKEFFSYNMFLLAKLIHSSFERSLRWEILLENDISLIRGKYVAGIISTLFKPTSIRKLKQVQGAPVVTINTQIPGMMSVCSDEQSAMRLAVEHLVEQGHQRIGLLVSDEDNWCNVNRMKGFKDSIKMAQLDPALNGVERIAPDAQSLRGIAKLLKRDLTAIIACGEPIGVQVASNLELLGKQVPEDISVICHECPGVSEYVIPAQTSLMQDFSQISELALDLLLSKDEATESPQQLIPYSLIKRESVGPARSR